MTGPYTQGETVRLSASVTDPATGNAVDPASITFKVLAPDSTTVLTPTVVRDALGAYHADVVPTGGGVWAWRVETTGPQAAKERTFPVEASRF